jgi:Thioredoxin
VHRLFAGIPQRVNVLGRPSAPVTLVEYVDLQCPFCQAFETQVMPKLVARYVRTGEVKVVMRPIAFIGPDSERGRLAALAAARQNRLFDFSELLYFNQGAENSGWLDDAMIRRAAASIPGLDVGTLLGVRDSASIRSQGGHLRLRRSDGRRPGDADDPRRPDRKNAAAGRERRRLDLGRDPEREPRLAGDGDRTRITSLEG